MLGYRNGTHNRFMFPIFNKTVNIRYSINIELPPMLTGTKTEYSIYIKSDKDLTISNGGGLSLKDKDNKTLNSIKYPTTMVAGQMYKMYDATVGITNAVKIIESGVPPFSTDTNIQVILMASPLAY